MLVLKDHLGHLLLGVFNDRLVSVRHPQHRDFRPDQQTVFVAQVIEIVRVLVMGQTQGICPHLAN